MDFAKKYLGGVHGIGIDVDQAKVSEARRRGNRAISMDILDLPNQKLIDFVVMSHFLEHVPLLESELYLEKAIRVAKKFVFIQQPFFDADSYLMSQGLRMYWSNWRNHVNNMTSYEIYRALARHQESGLISRFSIHLRKELADSSAEEIVPLNAPRDCQSYEDSMGKKPFVAFSPPLFREILVIASVDDAKHDELVSNLHGRLDKLLFDSKTFLRSESASVGYEKPE